MSERFVTDPRSARKTIHITTGKLERSGFSGGYTFAKGICGQHVYAPSFIQTVKDQRRCAKCFRGAGKPDGSAEVVRLRKLEADLKRARDEFRVDDWAYLTIDAVLNGTWPIPEPE